MTNQFIKIQSGWSLTSLSWNEQHRRKMEKVLGETAVPRQLEEQILRCWSALGVSGRLRRSHHSSCMSSWCERCLLVVFKSIQVMSQFPVHTLLSSLRNNIISLKEMSCDHLRRDLEAQSLQRGLVSPMSPQKHYFLDKQIFQLFVIQKNQHVTEFWNQHCKNIKIKTILWHPLSLSHHWQNAHI